MANETPPKKLRVGWFTFTCCEDSTMIFTELLGDHYFEWKDLIDFVHFKTVKGKNELANLDVAFVEGAISSEKQAQLLKKIRQVSKRLVAIGACAVTGLPSAQRNLFNPKIQTEIQPILEKFAFRPKVAKLDDLVKVDAKVGGCPMDEKAFLELFDNLLREFGVKN